MGADHRTTDKRTHIEMVHRFWDFYRKQRNDIANFDTFYAHFFSPSFWGPNKKRIQLLLNLGLAEPILEAGSGSGWVAYALYQKGFKPVSIDLLTKQLAQSSLLFQYFNMESRSVQTDMRALPFPKDYFSSAIVFNVLEHIKDFDQALQELHRVLKSSGVLFVTLTNGWGSYGILEDRLHRRFNLPLRRFLKRILLGDKGSVQKDGIEIYHEHLHGKSWWRRQFQAHGFKLLRSVNIESISTALFPRIGYEKCKTWSQWDCRLAEKLPSCFVSDWFFQLAKM